MTDKKISELTTLAGADMQATDQIVVARASTSQNFSMTRQEFLNSSDALLESSLESPSAVKALDQGVATTDSPSFTNLTATGGVATFGVSDTTRGIVQIHGNGTGSSLGGELRLFAAADHDTTVNYWRLWVDSETLKINVAGVGDGVRFNGSQEATFPQIATFSNGLTSDGPIVCQSYTVATVPSASSAGAGSLIYVTDETGGATHAASDGTNWRRMSDRAIIS